jgi:hypothetical protein
VSFLQLAHPISVRAPKENPYIHSIVQTKQKNYEKNRPTNASSFVTYEQRFANRLTAVVIAFSSRWRFGPAKGCQTSRHLAAARRASQRQLLDIGDGPNGADGWENRKTLAENAEMQRKER